jgi:putative transposase
LLQLAARFTWFKRNPGKKPELIFHSDCGSQYASDDFGEVLKEHGITPSMRRKGSCWDNVCSETLFGSLKWNGSIATILKLSAGQG